MTEDLESGRKCQTLRKQTLDWAILTWSFAVRKCPQRLIKRHAAFAHKGRLSSVDRPLHVALPCLVSISCWPIAVCHANGNTQPNAQSMATLNMLSLRNYAPCPTAARRPRSASTPANSNRPSRKYPPVVSIASLWSPPDSQLASP